MNPAGTYNARRRSAQQEPAGRHIQKTALAGLLGLIVWAAVTELDESVFATGQVVTSARTQVVQSADGGVLANLHVGEGQRVKKGALIAVFEKQRAKAATEDLQSQYAALHLALRRAQAEADGTRPEADATARQYPALWQAQLAVFDDHQRAIRIDIDAFNNALQLAEREQRIMEKLQASGDISATELMRSERAVLELRQRRDSILANAKTEARKEAARYAAEMVSLAQRIHERTDVLQRTDLYAPMDGVVHSIRFKTIGAVLRPGEELLQMVPDHSPNTLELRVNPTDIGRLREGLSASVKLDAWDYSVYGSLKGMITDISPDTVTEAAYPQPHVFYRVMMTVDNNPDNPKLDTGVLKTGMRASADILTGQRSLLWYLTAPVTRAFSGALRER